MTNNYNQLTKYSAGTIGELWTLSWPMIIASASNCVLLLIDRIILSYYSQEAFNISVECFPWSLGFWFTFFSLIGVTEVFVGQHNGARKFYKIGPIVWQMIWFSLSTYIIFIPVCLYTTKYMLANPTSDSLGYLRITLLYSPISYATFGALGSFFVGRGKTKFITLLSIVDSILNAIFDILLVFGYCGFPQLGCVGAAYATFIAQFTVFVISFLVFFSEGNHKKYHTRKFRLNLTQLKSCLAIGVPFAISSAINCFSFAFLIKILSKYSPVDEFTAFGLTHSFYSSLTFFTDGISKGVGTLCANFIGACRTDIIKNVLLSSIKIITIFILITSVLTIIFADSTIHNIFPLTSTTAQNTAIKMAYLVCICLFLDGIVVSLQAMLISAGDTKFIMISNLCIFLFTVVIPGYIGITQFSLFSKFLWILFLIDSCERILSFALRYKSGYWKNLKIMRT